LSTFSSKINLIHVRPESPFYLYEYDHEELTRCYERAMTVLKALIVDISADPEYVAPFIYDGQNYALDLPAKFLKGVKRYYLAVETNAPQEVVVAELEGQAKMSSSEYLPLLVAQSLPGIAIRHIPHPPPELPRRNMGIYFAINHKSRLWEKVVEKQNIALNWETHPIDAKIELMVAGKEV